jgi:hypothetical protein
MKKWLNRISIALANTEKNSLNKTGELLSTDVTQAQRHTQGQVADSLINGEVTQEVMDLRWRTYRVLNETNNYVSRIVGYEKDGTPITETVKKDFKVNLNKIKVDSFDKFPLIMVVNNEDIVNSGNEAMDNDYLVLLDKPTLNYDEEGNLSGATHGEISSTEFYATSKNDKPISVLSEVTRQFEIERYTKKLNIRKISETENLLEFYVSKYPDEYNKTSLFFLSRLKKIIENPTKANMLDIKFVDFVTNKTIGVADNLQYRYQINEFDKIVEFNGNYVIKFKADVIINGDNILEKYKQEGLENKYKNKTKK